MKMTLSPYLKMALLFIFMAIVLTSCTSIGLIDEKTMPMVINSVGDFLRTYIILQISVFLIGLLLSIIIGKGGYFVSLGLHFIWIVTYREYGFWIVLLLFALFSVITFLLRGLTLLIRGK